MLNKISQYIKEVVNGWEVSVGGQKARWTKVKNLKAGVKIAVASDRKLEFDEIVSIRRVGREQVYDIEVEGSRNFVGNGILAHNTTGKALAILNETGDQNILAASASGVTKFVLDRTGAITTGAWNGSVIGPAYGGTGVANNAASTLAISGNFATTLTVSGTTGVTLPTSGTLYGTATGSITSSQLLTSLSDETGSGLAVFGTSPAITTSLTTGSTTFALVNTTATTVNFAGAATTLSIGAATGTTTVNNALTVSGAFTLGDNGDLGAIDTSDWNITSTGDLSGIGTIAADGNITQSGATTFTTGTGTVTVAGAATVSASLALGPQSAAPATCNAANEGRVYYSGTTGTKRLYVCDGTTWIPVAAGTLTGGASYQTISPEYPSAIISADGSNNVGTFTSDREATGSGSLYSFNYYEFSSGQTSLQDYDVYVRYEIPENFSSWATSNALTIDYATEDTSSANNKIDIQITRENDADTVTSTNNVSPTAGKWQSSILSSSPISFSNSNLTSAITWAAGDVAIIRIRLFSKDNYFARVGAIKFDWQ